jgi:pimeloyl-ACP methyl ester carboxylesterase
MRPFRRPEKWLLAGAFSVLATGVIVRILLWRGQENVPPPQGEDAVPFLKEEVRFRCGDNVLAGVLILPRTTGPHPAVAFAYGSGQADRTYFGTGPQLWEYFARHGFACLAWDKPGVGQSTGDYQTQTFPDRAEEALVAVRFLQGRPDVRRGQVGLWGHSQGGTVAPLAASLSPDVAFVIEVSGFQSPCWQQDLFRVEAELRADHFSEADIAKAVAFARMRMDLIRGKGPFEELDRAHPAVEKFPWFPYVGKCDRKLFYGARRLVGYDPGPAWEKVRCPVLVIYGALDRSAPAAESVRIIERRLRKAGNRDVTVKVFPGADHGLRITTTGGPKEARGRAGKKGPRRDFAPGYLDTMTAWLGDRFRPTR